MRLVHCPTNNTDLTFHNGTVHRVPLLTLAEGHRVNFKSNLCVCGPVYLHAIPVKNSYCGL